MSDGVRTHRSANGDVITLTSVTVADGVVRVSTTHDRKHPMGVIGRGDPLDPDVMTKPALDCSVWIEYSDGTDRPATPLRRSGGGHDGADGRWIDDLQADFAVSPHAEPTVVKLLFTTADDRWEESEVVPR